MPEKISDDEKFSCLGKIQHKSRLAAQYVLDTMNAMPRHSLEERDGVGLAVYECKYCLNFHIGHDKIERKWNKFKRKKKHANREHNSKETEADGQGCGIQAGDADVDQEMETCQ